MAMEEAGDYEAGSTSSRVGAEFGTQKPEAGSDGANTLPAPVQETPASGLRAGVRPRVMNSGGDKAGDRVATKKVSGSPAMNQIEPSGKVKRIRKTRSYGILTPIQDSGCSANVAT